MLELIWESVGDNLGMCLRCDGDDLVLSWGYLVTSWWCPGDVWAMIRECVGDDLGMFLR